MFFQFNFKYTNALSQCMSTHNHHNRSMFDISLIASIASHLTYWADEDVSHFMLSQLLSQPRIAQRDRSTSRAGEGINSVALVRE